MPQEAWEHAFQRLVFYFSRRHGVSNAEDLAQTTLLAVWQRPDYIFEKEEDFLRVCKGFAARIAKQEFRRIQRKPADPLPADIAVDEGGAYGMKFPELNVFLKEVCSAGATELRKTEWDLICRSTDSEGLASLAEEFRLGSANNSGVRLHRARAKLAQLVGWRKKRKTSE